MEEGGPITHPTPLENYIEAREILEDTLDKDIPPRNRYLVVEALEMYYEKMPIDKQAELYQSHEELLKRAKEKRRPIGYQIEVGRGEGCCPNCGCPDWSDTLEQTHNIFKEFWCNPGYKGCGAEFEIRETFRILGYRDIEPEEESDVE